MMIIDNKFNMGDTVYLTTDVDQRQRIVTGITVRPHGMFYHLAQGTVETEHFEVEISAEVNILVKVIGD